MSNRLDTNQTTFYSSIGVVFIETWSLFREFSNPNKFRVIHRLYEDSCTAGTLSEETGLTSSTVRSVLQSLRSSGFVDYDRQGKTHRYYLDFPLPDLTHELILTLVLMTEPPPKKRGQPQEVNVTNADREFLLSGYRDELLSERLKALAEILVPKPPGHRARDAAEYRERFEQLKSRINSLEERIDKDTESN